VTKMSERVNLYCQCYQLQYLAIDIDMIAQSDKKMLAKEIYL
jgi:hypothetical protein